MNLYDRLEPATLIQEKQGCFATGNGYRIGVSFFYWVRLQAQWFGSVLAESE